MGRAMRFASATSPFTVSRVTPARGLAVLQVVAELERLAERPCRTGTGTAVTAGEPPASAAPISSGPSTV